MQMIRPGFGIIFFLALRGVRKHAFSSFLAILTIAMAVGLFLSTWKINDDTRLAFNHSAGGFDAVLGARGSKLQIILNSLFHLESSPGNLSWEQYEIIRNTKGVKEAYPIAVGDNYLGYRLVGTAPELLTSHQWKPGQGYQVEEGGRVFSPLAKEAVVGSLVAQKIGLQVGDQFHPYHGLHFKEENKHRDIYVVVGILKATGTPADRVIWVPIKGIQLMDGHDKSMSHSLSAVLLSLKGAAGFSLDMKYNRQGNVATLAWPVASTLSSFLDKFSWFQKILELVAGMIAGVGALIIVLTLRNSMNERRREFAILRCLGASRTSVSTVIISQSLILACLGVIAGFCFHFLIHIFVSHVIRENTGVLMSGFSVGFVGLYVFCSVLVIGLISGILPARQVYKADLSENLKHHT